jgi:hypothetical protein
MRKFIALAALFLLTITNQTLAQVDRDPDGLGIYFDMDATQYCLDYVGGQLCAYLILTNCSEPTGILGWECFVTYTIPAGCSEIGWTLPAGSLNVATPPEFTVGLPAPVPNAPTILLATLCLMILSADPMEFYVGPVHCTSFPTVPLYAAGDNSGRLIEMHPASGSFYLPVAQLNGDCTVIGTENATFGHVKAMYR